MNLKPYWHGRMTDRGTVFWCANEDGKAVCYKEQGFWGMKYAERKDVEPRVLGEIKTHLISGEGIYKDDRRILTPGRG